MGHTKPQDLKDVRAELAEIRSLAGLTEKSPGIFYFKCSGFLHFHDKDGKRWADVKIDDDWHKLEVDFGSTAAQKRAFIRQVKKAHRAMTDKVRDEN